MHLQPVFRGWRISGGELSENFFERGLGPPSETQMTAGDLERVVKVIKSCCKEGKRK
jgi:dTDP-4-amino-4,6-dideoxygalactose transaminase